MTDIRNYIARSARTYPYRIKTVIPLDDKTMDKIELILAKYRPLRVERARKTLLQSNPLDFYNVQNAEVYWCDCVLGLPASPFVLQQEIRATLHCPLEHVVVRGENDPAEIEGEKMAALAEIDAEAAEKGLTPKGHLATDPADEPSADMDRYYGDGYNQRLLAYLKKVREERVEPRVEPLNPLFKWLDAPTNKGEPRQDERDFNYSVKGAPPSPTNMRASRNLGYDPNITHNGNFDDNHRTYSKTFVDQQGRDRTIARTVDSVRKEY